MNIIIHVISSPTIEKEGKDGGKEHLRLIQHLIHRPNDRTSTLRRPHACFILRSWH